MAYRCQVEKLVYCLVGSVITLYSVSGEKLKQWFFGSAAEAKAVYFASIGQALAFKVDAFFLLVVGGCNRKEYKMPQVKVSDEITLYISNEDFNRLVSETRISESDVKFRESDSLNSILAEFGF